MKEGERHLLASVTQGINDHNPASFLVSALFAVKRQSALLESGFSHRLLCPLEWGRSDEVPAPSLLSPAFAIVMRKTCPEGRLGGSGREAFDSWFLLRS